MRHSRVRKAGRPTCYIYHKIRVRHFGPYGGTVRTTGLDSSVLRSEVSFGHFGTSAEMFGNFGPI